MYNFALIGTSENIESQFTIKLFKNESHTNFLHESQPFEDEVGYDKYKYYKFYISDTSVKLINFELLTIHGDAQMMVSCSDEQPSKDNFEKKSNSYSSDLDTVVYSLNNDEDKNLNGDLTGYYYIAVYGKMMSSYRIHYEVERTHLNNEGQWSSIQLPTILYQDKATRGRIHRTFDFKKYTFSVNNVSKSEEIIIKLTRQEGHFRFYVKYHGEASPQNYDLKGDASTHYYVAFDPSQNSKYSNGDYSIYVEPVVPIEDMDKFFHYSFLVSYSIGTIHSALLNTQPTTGFATPSHFEYFTFKYNSKASRIKVEISKLSGDLQTIVALRQVVTMPTIDSVDDEKGVFLYESESIIFDKSKLELYCNSDKVDTCQAHIVVMGVNPDVKSTFAIAAAAYMAGDAHIMKIQKSVPTTHTLKLNEWIYYWVSADDLEAIIASLVPEYGTAEIYASIVTDLSVGPSEWKLPTELANDKHSVDSISAERIYFDVDELKHCLNS